MTIIPWGEESDTMFVESYGYKSVASSWPLAKALRITHKQLVTTIQNQKDKLVLQNPDLPIEFGEGFGVCGPVHNPDDPTSDPSYYWGDNKKQEVFYTLSRGAVTVLLLSFKTSTGFHLCLRAQMYFDYLDAKIERDTAHTLFDLLDMKSNKTVEDSRITDALNKLESVIAFNQKARMASILYLSRNSPVPNK